MDLTKSDTYCGKLIFRFENIPAYILRGKIKCEPSENNSSTLHRCLLRTVDLYSYMIWLSQTGVERVTTMVD